MLGDRGVSQLEGAMPKPLCVTDSLVITDRRCFGYKVRAVPRKITQAVSSHTEIQLTTSLINNPRPELHSTFQLSHLEHLQSWHQRPSTQS